MNTADTIDRAVVAVTQHSADTVARQPLSSHYPPFDSMLLALAEGVEEIDRITDKLVLDGLARARDDASMLEVLRASARARFGGRK